MHRLDQVDGGTAADADVLSGSSLDPVPSNGVMRVFPCSTVNTATIAITPSKHPSPTGAGTQIVQLRANAEVRDYDPYFEFEVEKGEKVVIGIAGTTGTWRVWTSFLGG